MIPEQHKKRILELLAEGDRAKEIGTKMEISHRTIERHIEIIKAIHRAKNLHHLVSIALREKLIK